MVAAVLALLAAVMVTVTYRVLTEHLDYASVRRRQLDVWAATAAIACFGLIVYGNATTPRVQAPPLPTELLVPPDAAADPVRRMGGPTPVVSPPPQIEPAVAPVTIEDPGAVAVVLAEAPSVLPDADTRVEQSPRPRATSASVYLGPETATATAVVLIESTPLPSPTARALEPRTATPRPSPTGRPQPTTVPPTEQPPPLPSATPHCGDPNDIRIVVSRLSTRRNDVGGEIVIDYSFDMRNDSTFPVTVAKMRVTVTRLGGGAEEFASHGLDDVTIEPGASYQIKRSITLETRPPPVGEVNLCLTYRTETCNEGVPRGGNRCRIVDGF
jgi:hypothetical protein